MRTIHNLNVNSLDPIETFTIKEIAKKLKDTGKFNLLSDKEFDEIIKMNESDLKRGITKKSGGSDVNGAVKPPMG